MQNETKPLRVFLCPICQKPVDYEPVNENDNPTIYHFDCAFADLEEARNHVNKVKK